MGKRLSLEEVKETLKSLRMEINDYDKEISVIKKKRTKSVRKLSAKRKQLANYVKEALIPKWNEFTSVKLEEVSFPSWVDPIIARRFQIVLRFYRSSSYTRINVFLQQGLTIEDVLKSDFKIDGNDPATQRVYEISLVPQTLGEKTLTEI